MDVMNNTGRVQRFLPIAVAFVLVIIQNCTQAVTTYAGIGCFKDRRGQNRAMTLLATYRKPRNYTMDWGDLENTVVKTCAVEAAKTSSAFFGIQFYGECWGGLGQYNRWGKSAKCDEIGGAFVGKQGANFVYMLTGNECSKYKMLDDPSRARIYTGSDRRCDTFGVNPSWTGGWYRFDGDAGQKMADSCVPSGSCGTDQPGYFVGTLPAVVDNITGAKVCFNNRGGTCCDSSVAILVRNCGAFYVYDLPPSSNGCFKAYCGNGR